MQHIGVRVEDESGKVIDTSNINFAEILNLLDSQENWEEQKNNIRGLQASTHMGILFSIYYKYHI